MTTQVPMTRRSSEVVLCDSDAARSAHRELFRFGDDDYVVCTEAPVACLLAQGTGMAKIHLCLGWQGILEVVLWKERPSIGEVVLLLKDAGLTETDLRPMAQAAIFDIFPMLYYGRNFDVLRKVCNLARRSAEERLRPAGCRVDCHLVAEDVRKIVASSL